MTNRKPVPGQRALRKGRASIENAAYSITACTAEQRPVFASPDNAQILVDGIRWLRQTGRIWILAHVIMPDHAHLVLALRSGATLSGVMQVWKGFTARAIRKKSDIPTPIWQRGYYDHMIRDERDLRIRREYVHYNPVRKGLVGSPEEYKFSTAHPDCETNVDFWWMA